MLILDKNGTLSEVEPDLHQAALGAELREYLTTKADLNGNINTEAMIDWFIADKTRNEKLVDALFNRLDDIKKKVLYQQEQEQEEELEGVRGRIAQVQAFIKCTEDSIYHMFSKGVDKTVKVAQIANEAQSFLQPMFTKDGLASVLSLKESIVEHRLPYVGYDDHGWFISIDGKSKEYVSKNVPEPESDHKLKSIENVIDR